jgi:hypothetical protein
MLENTEGTIKKDNPETLVILGTQDTGQICLPLRLPLTFVCSVSYVPNITSVSGLPCLDCPFGLL